MRKHLIWVLGIAVAIASVGFATAAVNTQSITGKITPKKLPKTGKKQAVSLDVNVFSTHPVGGDRPPDGTGGAISHATARALVDFDKDMHFQQKGFPVCPEGGGDPTTVFGSSTQTDDVRKACPDAILGNGSATVKVPTATGAATIPADVIAANVSGNRILLHSYNVSSGGQPLVGKLTKQAGKYGTLLTVPVPPLAGGAATLTQFQALINKVVYRFKGKKRAIIASTCKDKKIEYQARFTDDVGQTAVGTFTQPCTQKAAPQQGRGGGKGK